MEKDERPELTEVAMTIRVSESIRTLVEDLCYTKIRGVESKVDDQTGVLRRALLIGLKQIVDEREGVAVCPLCKGSGRATDEDIKRFLGSEP